MKSIYSLVSCGGSRMHYLCLIQVLFSISNISPRLRSSLKNEAPETRLTGCIQ